MPNSSAMKSLFKHSSIYGIGTIAAQAVGFLLLPLYTRYLTPADYGVAALIEIFMTLVGFTVGFCILDSMARFYHAQDSESLRNKIVSTMYWMMLTISIVAFTAIISFSLLLSSFIFSDSRYADLFNINAASLALGFMVDVGLMYLLIKKRSILYVSISLVTLILQVGLNVWFIVFMGMGLIGIFYSTLVVRAILVVVITLPILMKVGVGFSISKAKDMFIFSYPITISNLFRLAVNESDKYFINYFISPFETGIYAIASKIGYAIHALITVSFQQSYGPKRFEIMKQDNPGEVYAKILNYYLLMVSLAGFLLSVFSNEIIRLMTTSNYYEAAYYIPLIVTAWIIYGTRNHFETGILITKKTKYIAYINGFSAFLCIFLNYYLIGHFKIWGALVAVNISQLITTVLYFRISQKLYPVRFQIFFIAKLATIIFLLGLLSFFVRFESIYLNLLLKFAIVALYLISLFIFGLIDDALLGQLKRLLDLLLAKTKLNSAL